MEHRIHQWLKTNFDAEYARRFSFLETGIGDDAAVLVNEWADRGQRLVVTSDMIAEGTHFCFDAHFSKTVQQRLSRFPNVLQQVLRWRDSQCMSLFLAGRKLMAVNLSDLAAMAAVPKFATLNLQIPKSYSFEQVIALLEGCRQMADQFQLAIVGGDTNRWDGPLVLGATCVGVQAAETSGWQLSAAHPGDWILASGAFGASYATEKHWCFTPRVELASYLATHYSIHAATDVTDSLTIDLNAIAQASQVRMELNLKQIPIFGAGAAVRPNDRSSGNRFPDPFEFEAGNVTELRDGDRGILAALHDGEDFELILTAADEVAVSILADPNLPVPLTCLGRVVAGPVGICDEQGNDVEIRGYEH